MRVFRFIHFQFIQVFYRGPQIGCCRCRGRGCSCDHRYCVCNIVVVVSVAAAASVAVGSAVLHICIFSCFSRLSVFNSVLSRSMYGLCYLFFPLNVCRFLALTSRSLHTKTGPILCVCVYDIQRQFQKISPVVYFVYFFLKSRYSSNFILTSKFIC